LDGCTDPCGHAGPDGRRDLHHVVRDVRPAPMGTMIRDTLP
jgi:hypothetical protein